MILWEQDQINDRWKGYFDNLLHLENLWAPGISSEEVELALRIMKTIGRPWPGKDGIPVQRGSDLELEGLIIRNKGWYVCRKRNRGFWRRHRFDRRNSIIIT